MFEKLKKKWKVSGVQLFLILCTFAIGGSLCGYVARRIMTLFPMEKDVLWYVIYILLVTLLWPIAVLLVSIIFGQFPFFKNYLSRVAKKLGLKK